MKPRDAVEWLALIQLAPRIGGLAPEVCEKGRELIERSSAELTCVDVPAEMLRAFLFQAFKEGKAQYHQIASAPPIPDGHWRVTWKTQPRRRGPTTKRAQKDADRKLAALPPELRTTDKIEKLTTSLGVDERTAYRALARRKR